MRLARLAVAALIACAPCLWATAGEPPPRGWEAALAEGAPVAVTATPVDLTGGELSGLALRGAWELRGDHRNFGGFSGLIVSRDRLSAVSDTGWWLGASLTGADGDLRIRDAVMAPMQDGAGRRYTKFRGDAEGLTLVGRQLAVSFERDDRIMVLQDSGRLGGTIQPRSFRRRFRSNKGLEALAALPDDRLIGLAEGAEDNGVPVFVTDPGGGVVESRLPRPGAHSVTGADVGPDGRLYLVLREYSWLSGVSIRVMRYRLGADGWPVPDSAELLAAFEAESGIDNMEGISLSPGPRGEVLLWLISDDNFRSVQRTLLVAFQVLP